MIHHVPIPAEIKAILDNIYSRGSSSRVSGGSTAIPPLDRKSSGTASPKTNSLAVKSSTMAPPTGKVRPTGSPQQLSTPLANTGSKGSAPPSSLPNSVALDRYRQVGSGKLEERVDP